MKDIYLEHEMLTLWQTCKAHRYDPRWSRKIFAVWLLFATGMRISEAASLRLEDCLDKVVLVRHGKGDKSRDVEILPEFRSHYRYYLRCVWGDKGRWLFRGFNRKHIDVRAYRKWWGEVIALAGLRYLSPHSARRSFISWFSDRLTMQEMKDQVGHSTIATTEKHYRVSIPGRRFEKTTPTWIAAMTEVPVQALNEVSK